MAMRELDVRRLTARGVVASAEPEGTAVPRSATVHQLPSALSERETPAVPPVRTRRSQARKRGRLRASEAGMATAEYAIATLAAVGLAGLLVVILRSEEVRGFLLNLIRTALQLP
ncbi:DUF4244 domain-containing protein [Paenarthrobacter sp. NPDC092416]|uniref:DUF4244 domain-containing protein n=1 Tax=Paenarthrobacter sp. NPDC092416 TaxID=3364386 RepID=UPI003809CE85